MHQDFERDLIMTHSRLRKIITGFLSVSVVAGLAFALVGCGSDASDDTTGDTTDTTESKTITVGASPTPHAEILAIAKEQLAEEGITLNIIEYTDYVIPNTALESGEIDANYFQHVPYLDDFNAENDTHLVAVEPIHFEPLGIYAGTTASIDALADGARIAVPNDATNEARALLLLADQGLITLEDDTDLSATVRDIVDNPKNIEFVEVEAAAVPRSLSEVDLAVINGNYALSAGLTADDILVSEDVDSLAAQTYANVLVVKEGNEDNENIKALVAALTSEEVRTFINDNYKGSVVPVF